MTNITMPQNGANSQVNVNGANEPMTKRKLVPFNIEKAKAGAKVVTRCGYPIRIGFFDVKNEDYPVAAAVRIDEGEIICSYTLDGKHGVNEEDNVEDEDIFDLFIEEEELETCEKNNDAICSNRYECFKAILNAKPGDILASKDGLDILIFKGVDSIDHFSSYYNIRGKNNYGWKNTKFIPANEEQRSRLFQELENESAPH